MARSVGMVTVSVDNTKEVVERLHDAILAGLEEIGIDAEKIASENAPVDTGRLSASITHAIDEGDTSVVIGTNVEYAPYQELGTSTYKGANGGRGYLRPAVTENKGRFAAIMERHLENG